MQIINYEIRKLFHPTNICGADKRISITQHDRV